MIVKDKKEYIAPQAKTVEVEGGALLVDSPALGGGGDNTQPGAPTVAEGKYDPFFDEFDEE